LSVCGEKSAEIRIIAAFIYKG